MGVLPLIVVGGIPAEVIRMDIHSGGNVVAVGSEQVHPRLGVIVSKPGGILPFQGEDVCPHVAGILIQLQHGLLQVHAVLVSKEAVVTQPLRSWTGGNVLHVAV